MGSQLKEHDLDRETLANNMNQPTITAIIHERMVVNNYRSPFLLHAVEGNISVSSDFMGWEAIKAVALFS